MAGASGGPRGTRTPARPPLISGFHMVLGCLETARVERETHTHTEREGEWERERESGRKKERKRERDR